MRHIASELIAFRSLNVVGERRMGKTSVINHLVGRQDQLLVEREGQPPLVLAHLDLQDHISEAVATLMRREIIKRDGEDFQIIVPLVAEYVRSVRPQI